MTDMGPFQYFICGGFGGICTVLVGHPLDTIKVRLQTMPVPKAGEKPLYSGTLDCFKTTIRNEGFRGLYKGMGAPLAGVAPIFAISFMGYGLGKQLLGPKEGQFTYLDYFKAGAFSGIFTTIIMAPGERIKCLLQIQHGTSGPKMYSGPVDVVKKLYKQGGIRSIYRGSGATLLRDIPASGMYFLAYEAIKDYVTDYGKTEPTLAGTILAGGAAGIANWLVGMPPDVLKSRLQTELVPRNCVICQLNKYFSVRAFHADNARVFCAANIDNKIVFLSLVFQSAPEGTYPKGIRDVFKELMKKEGPFALYKGITPVMLRAIPANAACFVGFELCKKFLMWLSAPKSESIPE